MVATVPQIRHELIAVWKIAAQNAGQLGMLVFDYEHEHRRERLSTSTETAPYFTIAHG